jgi:hypothetical protein
MASLREDLASALASEKSLGQIAADTLRKGALGTREWVEINAGKRAGRLLSITEGEMRKSNGAVDHVFRGFEKEADKLFDESPEAYEAFVNMGMQGNSSKVGPTIPKSYEQALKGMPEDSPIRMMADTANEINANDFPGWKEGNQVLEDFFPRKSKGKMVKGMTPRVNDYEKPTVVLKEYAQDVFDARILAQTFFKGFMEFFIYCFSHFLQADLCSFHQLFLILVHLIELLTLQVVELFNVFRKCILKLFEVDFQFYSIFFCCSI